MVEDGGVTTTFSALLVKFIKHVCAILILLFTSVLAVVLLYLILDSILGL